MNITKHITGREAKNLGTWYRMRFTSCDEKYRGKAIYVIEFAGGGVKIGVAQNLCRRLKDYDKPWIRTIISKKFYKHNNPNHLELLLKRKFKQYKKHGSDEYFDTQISEITNFIENNGFFY